MKFGILFLFLILNFLSICWCCLSPENGSTKFWTTPTTSSSIRPNSTSSISEGTSSTITNSKSSTFTPNLSGNTFIVPTVNVIPSDAPNTAEYRTTEAENENAASSESRNFFSSSRSPTPETGLSSESPDEPISSSSTISTTVRSSATSSSSKPENTLSTISKSNSTDFPTTVTPVLSGHTFTIPTIDTTFGTSEMPAQPETSESRTTEAEFSTKPSENATTSENKIFSSSSRSPTAEVGIPSESPDESTSSPHFTSSTVKPEYTSSTIDVFKSTTITPELSGHTFVVPTVETTFGSSESPELPNTPESRTTKAESSTRHYETSSSPKSTFSSSSRSPTAEVGISSESPDEPTSSSSFILTTDKSSATLSSSNPDGLSSTILVSKPIESRTTATPVLSGHTFTVPTIDATFGSSESPELPNTPESITTEADPLTRSSENATTSESRISPTSQASLSSESPDEPTSSRPSSTSPHSGSTWSTITSYNSTNFSTTATPVLSGHTFIVPTVETTFGTSENRTTPEGNNFSSTSRSPTSQTGLSSESPDEPTSSSHFISSTTTFSSNLTTILSTTPATCDCTFPTSSVSTGMSFFDKLKITQLSPCSYQLLCDQNQSYLTAKVPANFSSNPYNLFVFRFYPVFNSDNTPIDYFSQFGITCRDKLWYITKIPGMVDTSPGASRPLVNGTSWNDQGYRFQITEVLCQAPGLG